DSSQDGLWDVTLINNASDTGVQLLAYDFINGTVRKPTNPPTVPIGEWFHIQFYLKRASNATGAIRLYQNGKLLVEKTGIVTDDSTWGQWFVGNIAKGLTPPDSTLYVDDVTIDTTGISL
ncbi:MAG TPA: heparin lyase I family protein, partial [Polyangiaceae bacterium]|nr:heparin lyase I family protein [Polyangiaceae bacterium]